MPRVLVTGMSGVGKSTNNSYGKSAAHVAEVREYVRTVEPLRRSAALELDAERAPEELVDEVEALLRAAGSA